MRLALFPALLVALFSATIARDAFAADYPDIKPAPRRRVKAFGQDPNPEEIVPEKKVPAKSGSPSNPMGRARMQLQWSPYEPKADSPRTPPGDHAGIGQVVDLNAPVSGRAGRDEVGSPLTSIDLRDASESLLTPADRTAYHAAINEARRYLSAGNLAAADRAASEALDHNPESPTAFSLQAEAANRAEDYARAERLARFSLDLQPSAAAYQNAAWAELNLGKLEEALEASNEALKRNPNSKVGVAIREKVQEALGERKLAASRLQGASDSLQKALGGYGSRTPGRAPSGEDEAMLADELSKARGAPSTAGGLSMLIGGLLAAAVSGIAGFFWLRARGSGLPPASAAPLLMKNPLIAPRKRESRIGKYVLGRMIGRGGMGVVYEAEDRMLKRTVAIKKVSATMAAQGEEWREAYLKEARIVASLHHPAIVEIFDIVQDDLDIYLVFEFVRGVTVHELLAEKGPLSLARAAEILRPICQALSFAHKRRLVHRDLKPMNIMVTDEGAKLMDFGIARTLTTSPDATQTQTVRGTPIYMAPEAWEGVVRVESDIYSLGICLYEMVTGALPFGGPAGPRVMPSADAFEPPSAKIAGLPALLDQLLLCALDPEPTKRIRSAVDFLRRLEACSGAGAKTPV